MSTGLPSADLCGKDLSLASCAVLVIGASFWAFSICFSTSGLNATKLFDFVWANISFSSISPVTFNTKIPSSFPSVGFFEWI